MILYTRHKFLGAISQPAALHFLARWRESDYCVLKIRGGLMFKCFSMVSATIFFAITMGQNATAFPTVRANMTAMNLPASFTANYDFEGIVGLSDCSGSLVQLENAADTDRGMILTNGHCY